MAPAVWDAIIVGGGPAGLSAALTLGRCRRRVLVCDRGTPRSWASKEMHGFISRDGIPPKDFLQLARDELSRYDSVVVETADVSDVRRENGSGLFVVESDDGNVRRCRKVLIATGLFDELPPVDGARDMFGISVFQCPYCDGWENRDRPIAVYGNGSRGYQMAAAMITWTRDIVLCTDGPARLSLERREALHRFDIPIVETPIRQLVGTDGRLESIEFENGDLRPVSAMFFDTPCRPQSSLAKKLGCAFTRQLGIRCGRYSESSVPGAYAAGNITRDVQLAVVAAAEGTKAAFGINRALTAEDFHGTFDRASRCRTRGRGRADGSDPGRQRLHFSGRRAPCVDCQP